MNTALTYFANGYTVSRVVRSEQPDHLPSGVYSFEYSKDQGTFYITKQLDKFNLPKTIYGDAVAISKLIYDDFVTGSKNILAAALVGNKGNGKTLISHLIANRAILQGMPVVLIDPSHPVPSEVIQTFAETIPNIVFILDEFGKLYPTNLAEGNGRGAGSHFHDELAAANAPQAAFLSILSSTLIRKALFVLTENESCMFSKYMIHRPDRIKYMIKYGLNIPQVYKEISSTYNINPIVQEYIKIALSAPVAAREHNLDTLKTLAEIAACSDSVKTLIETLEYINIPKLGKIKYSFSGVRSIDQTNNKLYQLDMVAVKGEEDNQTIQIHISEIPEKDEPPHRQLLLEIPASRFEDLIIQSNFKYDIEISIDEFNIFVQRIIEPECEEKGSNINVALEQPNYTSIYSIKGNKLPYCFLVYRKPPGFFPATKTEQDKEDNTTVDPSQLRLRQHEVSYSNVLAIKKYSAEDQDNNPSCY